MEFETLRRDIPGRAPAFMASGGLPRSISRDQLAERLTGLTASADLTRVMRLLTDYVGASHFLLARSDLLQEQGLDYVITSDWPFDLVRRIGAILSNLSARMTELEKCMSVMQPVFHMLPDEAVVSAETSRQYCAMSFSVGRSRLVLLFLYPDGIVLSHERLRDIGLLTGYFFSFRKGAEPRADRDFELTDRELECLFWIAEGKTSDEIAVILGISRNTINNYITSVMRKTATRTRSEAIAHAVRNNLV